MAGARCHLQVTEAGVGGGLWPQAAWLQADTRGPTALRKEPMRGDAATGNGHRQPPRAHHEAFWVFTRSRVSAYAGQSAGLAGHIPSPALQGGKNTKQRRGHSLSLSVWTASLEGPRASGRAALRCECGAALTAVQAWSPRSLPGWGPWAGRDSPWEMDEPHAAPQWTSHGPPPDTVWVHVCVSVWAVRGDVCDCACVWVCIRVWGVYTHMCTHVGTHAPACSVLQREREPAD